SPACTAWFFLTTSSALSATVWTKSLGAALASTWLWASAGAEAISPDRASTPAASRACRPLGVGRENKALNIKRGLLAGFYCAAPDASGATDVSSAPSGLVLTSPSSSEHSAP